MRAVLTLVFLTLGASAATAAEFQPIGTLGVGGAGVARPPDGTAPYWNPAALAFNTRPFAAKVGAGAAATANNGLADDVERLSRLDIDALENLTGAPAADQAIVADVVQAIALLEKIDREEGALTARGQALFGSHVYRFGFGAYGSAEAVSTPVVDTLNVLPELGGAPITAAGFAAAVGAAGPVADSNAFFSAAQRASIEAALAAAGVANADDVVDVFDAQLAASNEAGVTSDEATRGLVAVATALGGGGPLDANASSLRNRGLGYAEFPLAYGHPVRLGPLGTLGLGASVKLLRGRVYASQISIFETEADEVVDELRETYEESTTWGVDAGALWRPGDRVGVGVVGKHLNRPKFKAPVGPDVELKPQVRAGVAVTLLSWLTIAADLDLTENETALEGYRSRNLGGGVELHPFAWLKLRGGAYKNLAESDISPVLTAGLTLGIPWVTFDVDGAAALDTARYDGEDYPEEARVQASLNVRF
jgi:hypothetical protein